MNRTTVYVCTSCRRRTGEGEADFEQPGRAFAEGVSRLLADDTDIDVVPMECLSVCKRPCTVALAAPGKWSYVVGDLDGEAHCADVATAARAFAASSDGIVPWRERPQTFRKGVVSRVPPLGFVPPPKVPGEAPA